MLGFILLSVLTVKPSNKLKMFILSILASNTLIVAAVNMHNFIIMVPLLAIAGFFNSLVNVLLISTVQASTPQEVRGKVMSFISMTTSGLTPFAMALGGVLGGIFPIKLVISAAFIAGLFVAIPSCFSVSFRKYISADYGANVVTEIISDEL